MSDYSLGESAKGLGKLCPILKDKRGNIIDGFHRQNADPDWPCITVETVDDDRKLELARLASNFCRRTIEVGEFRNRLKFLIGKCGMKPEEIQEQTGISLTTIYKYMPQELKDQTKVEAGKLGGEAATLAKQTVKTQDVSELACCEVDNVSTAKDSLKLWHGYLLCPTHFVKAEANPELFEQTLGYKKNEKNGKVPASLIKPKSIDSWKERKAHMQVQHSKMELDVAVELQNHDELRPIAEREFCLLSTRPDFYFTKLNLAVYLDGQPHEGKEDRDERLRELLTKRHGVKVLSIKTKGLNPKEVVEEILKLAKA